MVGRVGLVACVLVGAVVAGVRAEGRVPDVKEALEAKRDVWGEIAMREPGGPTYEFFEGLVPPLRYVNTEFRHYPIAMAGPFGKVKGRVVSNGSGINLPTGMVGKGWYDYPVGVATGVGGDGFGRDLKRLRGPSYDKGYLPIVKMAYQVGVSNVTEEAFVPAEGELAEHGVVVVRLSASDAGEVPVTLSLKTAGKIEERKAVWVDEKERAVVWAGKGWTSDPAGRRLTGTLKRGESLYFGVVTAPMDPAALGELDEGAYARLRQACEAAWEGQLAKCARLEVPEERVNDAWKATVVGNLMMASGDEMSYSAGNGYQRMYEAESGDAVRALMVFGLTDAAQRMTNPLMRYVQQGLGYHDAAFKLQLLAHVYWVTRDAEYVRSRRELWRKSVDVILDQREKGSGLLPKENYCGDIDTQVYSLNSNANGWRGLRDMAAVLRDMGENEEAGKIEAEAEKFREAILGALAKSERRDVTPTFIPIALFGAEQPYERLTDSKMGSYWDLMIPYVLGSGILDDERERAAIDYLQERGGVCMGMIRFDQHSGLFANEKGVDDLYGLRYVQALLRRDDVDRALVSFYGKLAQGMTRETYIGGEGSSLVALDEGGRPMYLPPNASGNALFLNTLRELLVQDQDLDGDGRPETLRLLFGTPRGWMGDGKVVRVEGAPTAFGAVSVVARSELSKGRVVVEVAPPAREVKVMKVRARVPAGWRVVGARIGETVLKVDERGTVELPAGKEKVVVEFTTVHE